MVLDGAAMKVFTFVFLSTIKNLCLYLGDPIDFEAEEKNYVPIRELLKIRFSTDADGKPATEEEVINRDIRVFNLNTQFVTGCRSNCGS
jgi:hypothetical protein